MSAVIGVIKQGKWIRCISAILLIALVSLSVASCRSEEDEFALMVNAFADYTEGFTTYEFRSITRYDYESEDHAITREYYAVELVVQYKGEDRNRDGVFSVAPDGSYAYIANEDLKFGTVVAQRYKKAIASQEGRVLTSEEIQAITERIDRLHAEWAAESSTESDTVS